MGASLYSQHKKESPYPLFQFTSMPDSDTLTKYFLEDQPAAMADHKEDRFL
jgi:hypothetical protein